MNEPETSADISDREIVFSREFNYPRELVFRAWTDPEHVPRWWEPHGFTTTTYSMDVRPGGVWRFCMHGPDGRDYENKITYLEVVPPERIVYQHGGDKDREPVSFQTTVTFEDVDGKTQLRMQMLFPSRQARDFVIKTYKADEGGKQTLQRLSEHLTRM